MKTKEMNVQANNVDNVEGDDIQNYGSRTPCLLDDILGETVHFDGISLDDCGQTLLNKENDCSLSRVDSPRIQQTSDGVSRTVNRPSRFGSDRDEEIKLGGWMDIRKAEWDENDTIQWLLWAGEKLGQPYSQVSPALAMTGRELLRLSKQDFIDRDGVYGERFYALFYEELNSKCLAGLDKLHLPSDDESTFGSESDNCDEESQTGPKCGEKRHPGRPRIFPRKTKEPRVKLWQFLRNLLHDQKNSSRLLCWEDYDNKVFRLIDPHELARLWGERDGKIREKDMSYENFSRAMRYYYKQGILETVLGRRLVYKFGKMATGFEIGSPNSSPKDIRSVIKSEFS